MENLMFYNKSTKTNPVEGMKLATEAYKANPSNFVIPEGSNRNAVNTNLGSSYLVKDQNGDVMPNYDILIKYYDEADNSFDYTSIVDYYSGKNYNSSEIFQTDQITGSSDSVINSGNDIGSKFADAKLRNVKVILTEDYETKKTQISTLDNIDGIVSIDLIASKLKQHARQIKFKRNAFILNVIVNNAIEVGAFTFNVDAVNKNAELVSLGEKITGLLRVYFTFYEEIMTVERPGGFIPSELFTSMSPLAKKAIAAYQTSLGANGDLAYTEGTEGTVHNQKVYDVVLYKDNKLVYDQKLITNPGTEFEKLEFHNEDGVEVIFGPKEYVKVLEAYNISQSGPITVDGMTSPYLFGQKIKTQFGAGVIAPLFGKILITRVKAASAVVSNIVGTDPTTVGGTDGTLTANILIKNFVGNGTAQLMKDGVKSGAAKPLTDGTNGVSFSGLAAGVYSIDVLDGTTVITSSLETIINDGVAVLNATLSDNPNSDYLSLQKEAKDLGLDYKGKKADLIARINAFKAENSTN